MNINYLFYVVYRNNSMEGSSTLRGSNKSHSKAISNILNDDLLTTPSHMSVFREDYPVHEIYRPSEIARPPPLGDIMHKDEKYFCNHTSETVRTVLFYSKTPLHPQQKKNKSFINCYRFFSSHLIVDFKGIMGELFFQCQCKA